MSGVHWPAVIFVAGSIPVSSLAGLPLPGDFDEARNRAPGYLAAASLAAPAIVSPPPVAGSAAQASDDEAYRGVVRLHGGERWRLAQHDAVGEYPLAADRFSCALGVTITPQAVPHIYMLLRRSAIDAGGAAAIAKSRFDRRRPFVAAGDAICTPDVEAVFRKDTSYPSSAAAIGWTWALILAEVDPGNVPALLRRGLAYGESREVCRVHWRSDVAAGRMLASVVVAQLHSSDEFLAQVAAARQDLAAARSSGARPAGDCAAELRAINEPAYQEGKASK